MDIDEKITTNNNEENEIKNQTNIMIAKDARVAIYEEELENGESYFTADACLYLYLLLEEQMI